MLQRFHSLMKDVSGVTSIEYGLIVALVGCGIIASVGTLGSNVGTVLSAIVSGLGGVATTAPPPGNTNHFNG